MLSNARTKLAPHRVTIAATVILQAWLDAGQPDPGEPDAGESDAGPPGER